MGSRESVLTRLRWAAYLAAQVPLQRRIPFRSPAAIERAQSRNVRRMVAHAYEHVPHYREAMARLGLTPADFRQAADLARLPLIERDELQRDPERFVSDAHPLGAYVRRQSGGSSARPLELFREAGGSSGRPLTVFRLPFSTFQAAAYRERRLAVALKLAGKRGRVRQLRIGSPARMQEAAEGFRSRSLTPFPLRVAERRMTLLDPPGEAVRAINDYRPDFVHSYGSYMEALFVHLHRTGEQFHRPSVVLFGSDALPDAARRLITETFGIPVLSGYSAIEAAPIGFECEEHAGHHLNADLFPIRIVDEDGAEVPDGHSGAVVVSNLVNEGTILLNYRLGDVASRLTEGCGCGRPLPLLSFLEGRVDEWVESASGEQLHPQAVRTLFTDEEQVLRYQVAQRSTTTFEVAVVAADGCDRDRLVARLARKFADRFGAGTAIDVSFVDSLLRTEGGKVRTVLAMERRAGEEAQPRFTIERAAPGDREAVLDVMRPANMHHVPSPEMEELDLACFFLARADGRVVGAAGYKVLGEGRGKTTLLAVLPEYGGRGIGAALQEARLGAMRGLGVRTVTTNADRPATIAWYKRRYGYSEVGEIEKLAEFGDPEIDRWVTLELDLEDAARDA